MEYVQMGLDGQPALSLEDEITYEVRPEGFEVFKNAHKIKQLDEGFCRLYSTPKEYDALRLRTRINGKLKQEGVKLYQAQNNTPEQIINEVIKIHGRTDFYVACSGGKDSICLAHYIKTNYPDNFKGLLFVDTGVGIELTKQWLKEYAEKKGWPLHIVKHDDRISYESIVLGVGFPGAGFHNWVMKILKFVPMRTFAFEKDRKFKHCIISGTRRFESKRRSINTKPITREGNFYFCSPFYDQTDEWVYRYLLENGLEITPVHKILGMSGECMCGCFAGLGEREIIKQLDPKLDAQLTELENKIAAGDSEKAKKSPKWGAANNKKNTNQTSLVDPEIEANICGTECGGGTMRGMENI